MRVQELVDGASSLRPAKDIERISDTNLILDIPLSAQATTGATTTEIVLTTDETIIKKSEA